MANVFLSPSTQEFNTALSGRSEEYYMNLIADAMIPYLRASGISYGRNNRNMTTQESVNTANSGDYDFYLAIHSNASGELFSGQSQGAEIYYYPGSINGRRAADIFANNYKEIYPNDENIRIIPNPNYIELNKTKMPAILFEVAYHDNITDFNWLRNNINRIAENLSLSLADYFRVEFRKPLPYAIGTVNTSGGRLNIRRFPSVDAEVTGSLADNDKVRIYNNENGWFKIQANGKEGYVSSSFIRN